MNVEENLIDIVYITLFVCMIIIMLIGALWSLRFKLDVPEDKLRIMQIKSKKGMLLSFILILLLTTVMLLLPYFQKYEVVLNFVYFFCILIIFQFFVNNFKLYWRIRKKLNVISN